MGFRTSTQPRSACTARKASSRMRVNSASIDVAGLTVSSAIRYSTCRLSSDWAVRPGSPGPINTDGSLAFAELTIWSALWISRPSRQSIRRVDRGAASSGESNRNTVRPTCTSSPTRRACLSIRRPFTYVPLELCRSVSTKRPSRRARRACARDASPSWIRISFRTPRPRPISPSASSKRCPWSGPWITSR